MESFRCAHRAVLPTDRQLHRIDSTTRVEVILGMCFSHEEWAVALQVHETGNMESPELEKKRNKLTENSLEFIRCRLRDT